MNRKALIASTLISIVLTVVLWNICPTVVQGVDDLMYTFEYRNRSWILQHGVFALSFGLVPFFSFLIWKFGRYTTALSLIVHSLFTWAISLVASSLSFILFIESTVLDREFMTQHNLSIAKRALREQMMNVTIPVSVIIPILVLFFVALYRREKRKPLRDSHVID